MLQGSSRMIFIAKPAPAIVPKYFTRNILILPAARVPLGRAMMRRALLFRQVFIGKPFFVRTPARDRARNDWGLPGSKNGDPFFVRHALRRQTDGCDGKRRDTFLAPGKA
jgi:hypothetical protein